MIYNPPQGSLELPYRRGVGAFLINKNGLVFVGRRIGDYSDTWQMPQGGIDNGENPEQSIIRELGEEVGTDKVRIIGESKDWLTYDIPVHLKGVVWGGQFRGQIQKWYALEFLGTDDDINLNAHKMPEFKQWKWIGIFELLKYVVPFKRQLYEDIITEFNGLTEQIKLKK